MKTLDGKRPRNWIMAIYGVPGCGKSTLATYAPNPIFLDVEGGTDRVECIRYQADDWPEDRTQIKTWDELYLALRECYKSDFGTVVIDTLGAVEEILTAKILAETNKDREPDNQVESLADKQAFPYGRGFELLKSNWAAVTKILFQIKDSGKNVLCIGHESVTKVENPEGDNFDRYTLNVHNKSLTHIISKMDAVLFAQNEKVLQSKSGDKKVAIDTGRKVLHTTSKPTWEAKNRFELPEQWEYTIINGDDAKCNQLFEAIK